MNNDDNISFIVWGQHRCFCLSIDSHCLFRDICGSWSLVTPDTKRSSAVASRNVTVLNLRLFNDLRSWLLMRKSRHLCQATLVQSPSLLSAFLLPAVKPWAVDQLSSNVIPPPPPSTKVRPIRSYWIQVQTTLMSDNINSAKTPYPKKNSNKVGHVGLPMQIEKEKPTAGLNSTSRQESWKTSASTVRLSCEAVVHRLRDHFRPYCFCKSTDAASQRYRRLNPHEKNDSTTHNSQNTNESS